ncbi:MAG TPA: M6 family metalloprotease domain-containing protein [Gemmatimonadales bacterium]|nr:M6 family metalloprotease domain-containing protein [Gemmatimonadales bacterium]
MNMLTNGPTPSAAVSGTLVVPAVFFSYANTDVQFMTDTAQYTTALFSSTPPPGSPYTLRTFYKQMSNDSLIMSGRILGWIRLVNPEVAYTGTAGTCSGNPYGTSNCNGIFSGAAITGMQNGFREALATVDPQVDFGQFDNDGPDGIPNSGDDDGYVDMIMFAHPTKDGACGGFPGGADPSTNNHIWSHRYTLLNSYVTNDPAHIGNKSGFSMIHVADYFATSARGGASACDTTQIMPIGTAAHEFGHALSLPDLYDTQQSTEGSGQWGLMGSGNFTSPRSPSRMEAWSLNELGWVTLQQLTSNGTYALDAAATSRTAAIIRPPGPNPRGEYFLIENRQGGAAGLADSAMIRRHCQTSFQPVTCPGGLLIWHVDSSKIASNGFHNGNAVNVGSIHGLALEEADGLRQLWCAGAGCNRGDAGDPYPGVSGNTAFVYRTNPVATMNDGSFAGFGIDQITQVVPNGQMSFRVRFGSLTAVRATDTTAAIQFDAANYNAFRDLLDDGSNHTVGFVDSQVVGRTRFHFQSWSDGGAISHPITGSLGGGAVTASLLRDFKLKAIWGTGGTVQADTTIDLAGGTFIPQGRAVTLTATPDSAQVFGGWSGDTVTANAVVTLPMGRSYTLCAAFGTLAISSATTRPAGVMGAPYADTLRTSSGTCTNSWAITGGTLPQGLVLNGSSGIISGFPHEIGTFNYTATVTSGAQSQPKPFTMSMTAPSLATADVATQLLGPATPLNVDQVRYLDFLGNSNGVFDIGDFLAWVKATGAPLSAAMMQALPRKGGPR